MIHLLYTMACLLFIVRRLFCTTNRSAGPFLAAVHGPEIVLIQPNP